MCAARLFDFVTAHYRNGEAVVTDCYKIKFIFSRNGVPIMMKPVTKKHSKDMVTRI